MIFKIITTNIIVRLYICHVSFHSQSRIQYVRLVLLTTTQLSLVMFARGQYLCESVKAEL